MLVYEIISELMYDFAEKMHFDIKATGNKSTGDRRPKKIPKSPGLMVSSSGISNTLFLSTDPNELCDRINLLLQEKQAGKISNIIGEENFTIVNKLLEYKCISKKQHKSLHLECSN